MKIPTVMVVVRRRRRRPRGLGHLCAFGIDRLTVKRMECRVGATGWYVD